MQQNTFNPGNLSKTMLAICRLLIRLGGSPNFKGFWQCAQAVDLSIREPTRLTLVTKWLYPDVAKPFHTTWPAVERNIRTLRDLVWEKQPELLSEIAGFTLISRPKVASFLAILTFHFMDKLPDDAEQIKTQMYQDTGVESNLVAWRVIRHKITRSGPVAGPLRALFPAVVSVLYWCLGGVF